MFKLSVFVKRRMTSSMLCRSQKQFVGICIIMVFTSAISYYTFRAGKELIKDLRETNRIVQEQLKENVEQEKGTGCNMPELNPFAKEMMNFSEPVARVTCEGKDWVECFISQCYVSKDILKTMKNVVCTYRDIVYVNDLYYYIGNPGRVIGDEKYTLNRSDHVKISCTGTDMNGLSTQWHGLKAGFRPLPLKPSPPGREDLYNVMILCLDSTTHNSFIRSMHKSYKYLGRKLKAVFLNSYNTIGDDTTGALYPILTGKDEEERAKDAANNMPVNETDFIFHHLKGYGYRTAYLEDIPWFGTFQNKFVGFRHQPADHYLRSFLMDDRKNLGTSKGYSKKHCIGAVPYYQFLLDLSNQFLLLDGKKFGITFISDILHDNLDHLTKIDEALHAFLQTLARRGALEDTLLILMGDHGPRFSGLRDTYQSKIEMRLPLMAIMLPQKLKTVRPDAVTSLEHNKHVLTTPFDIHATILDVLDLKNFTSTHKISGSDLPRAMSLLEPITNSRSCAEAGVMPHWCACTNWYNMSQADPMYHNVAKLLAEYINVVSEEQRSKCAKRSLVSIEWVLGQIVDDKYSNYARLGAFEMNKFLELETASQKAPDEYYQAKIVMSPGNSVFEGTLIYNKVSNYYMITQRDISRISPYGDEPSCISATHPHLNKYCYCKDRLLNLTDFRNVSSTLF